MTALRPPDERRTFGRGGTGAGWTAGQRETTRSNQRGLLPAARLDDPSPSDVREMLGSQWCWWCGRGPWRSVSGHTARAHGIRASRIRELGGLMKGVPTVSLAVREAMRLRPQTAEGIGLRAAQKVPQRGRTRVLSEPARVAATARLKEYNDAHPDQRRQAALKRAASARRPHPCPVCGVVLPRANPVTCSPACRQEVRARTMRASLAKMASVR